MKQSGTDCSFVVDLGRSVEYSHAQLDQVIIQNIICPWYPSQKGVDFRDLTIETQFPAGAVLRTVLRVEDAVTRSTFVDYMNTQLVAQGRVFRFTDIPTQAWTFRLQLNIAIPGVNTNAIAVNLVGGGWSKLGFNLGPQTVTSGSFIAPSVYDFAQSPVILVQIPELAVGAGAISNILGTGILASIPCTTTFGGHIVWDNEQANSVNKIYSQQRKSVRYLTVNLLSCDQMPLESVRGGQNSQGKQGMEVILVISFR